MKSVVEASNRFTVDIHKTFRNEQIFAKENLFYSPSSVSVALAMTSVGARANTATQMAKVLHWSSTLSDELHDEEQQFLDALQKANSAKNQLLAANRLFVQNDFPIVPEFCEGTKKYYDAEIALVDYKADAEGARKQVNCWVEEKTKQKIKNLIAEGAFNSLTRLTLVNAIYFKGVWKHPFNAEDTHPQSLFVSESETMEVQMMHLLKELKMLDVGEKLACQMLELPYEGNVLSMVILLPHDMHGLSTLEKDITYEKLQEALASLKKSFPRKVAVSLPRFKMTQQFTLNGILKKMGATDMFDEAKADFSGITPGPEKVFVSYVIHKAFVELNEEGTEAAAATTMVMAPTCALPMHANFCVDHPFLFMIYHNQSETILFLGSVVRPKLGGE